MENLRYMLHQFRPQTALLFGHRYAINKTKMEEGYMAGGGYILSKKALIKFANLARNDSKFLSGVGAEDVGMGQALAHSAIFVDCRDELKQKRFFPLQFDESFKTYKPDFWYYRYRYYNYTRGSLSCCSDVPIAFHYIKPEKMFLLEYLIYRVHPFGLEKNLTETLPRKLKIEEIIKASDAKSLSPNFVNHTDYHQLDSDENKFNINGQ
jgi:glycoprotein-N-acetylgalactosamine 3-beta-galactosyltransferase